MNVKLFSVDGLSLHLISAHHAQSTENWRICCSSDGFMMVESAPHWHLQRHRSTE